jgi:hypothetical protein
MKKNKLYIALSLALASSMSFAAVTVSSPSTQFIASSQQNSSQDLAYKNYKDAVSTVAYYTAQVKTSQVALMGVQKTVQLLSKKLNDLIAYSKTKAASAQLESNTSKIRQLQAELVKVNNLLKEKQNVALGYSTKLNMSKTELLQVKAAYFKSKIGTATGVTEKSLMLQLELVYAQLDKHLSSIAYSDAVRKSNANFKSEGVYLTYLTDAAKKALDKASANLVMAEARIVKFQSQFKPPVTPPTGTLPE